MRGSRPREVGRDALRNSVHLYDLEGVGIAKPLKFVVVTLGVKRVGLHHDGSVTGFMATYRPRLPRCARRMPRGTPVSGFVADRNQHFHFEGVASQRSSPHSPDTSFRVGIGATREAQLRVGSCLAASEGVVKALSEVLKAQHYKSGSTRGSGEESLGEVTLWPQYTQSLGLGIEACAPDSNPFA